MAASIMMGTIVQLYNTAQCIGGSTVSALMCIELLPNDPTMSFSATRWLALEH